jgi:glucose-1-phosphate thymidylyltransferase
MAPTLELKFHMRFNLPRDGLAQAFIIGEKFIDGDNCSLILGDNIFYGHGMIESLVDATKLENGAVIFGYYVNDPERYGVVEFDKSGKVLGIEEKPLKPKSNYSIPGLYFYDNKVCEYARNLKPSPRGELEITDLNKVYLQKGQLTVNPLR